MARFTGYRVRAWLCSGIVFSCAVNPLWSQDEDPEPPNPAAPGVSAPDISSTPLIDGARTSVSRTGVRRSDARQSSLVEQTAVERQRSFMDAVRTAKESEELARDSFENGLMPLQDYADQARATLEVRLSVAALQNDRGAQVAALSAHVDSMRSAAKLLEEFDQPASAGWAADLAYSALLTANAEVRLAAARGDRASYGEALERSRQLADEQYTLREADFNEGLASLPSLSRAASYLTTATGAPAGQRGTAAPPDSKFADYLATLNNIVEQTTEFAELDSGVGRADRLHQAKFELAKAEGQAALQLKDAKGAATAFDRALESSQQMFQSQVEFHESGTASLREVADAWWSRVELMDLQARAGLQINSAAAKSSDNNLNQLYQLVDNTEDRDGRIPADIAYVKTLENLQGMWAREHAVAALAASQKADGTKPAVTRPRILEVGGQPAAAVPAPEGTQPTPAAQPKPGTIEGTTPVTVETTKQSPIEIVRPRRGPKK